MLSVDDSAIETEETSIEGLRLEKQLIKNSIKQLEPWLVNHKIECKQKNNEDSILFRNQGNSFYVDEQHDMEKHHKTWYFYTQSVATAPNDSDALALAFGNRSALLHHLKEYKECIKDCDRAIKIQAASDFLKAKLSFRKIECLVALKSSTTKSTCEETLVSFRRLKLNADLKDKLVEKIKNILNTTPTADSLEEVAEKVEPDLPEFPRQSEAPCASTAITIHYNRKWGRHIIATRKIDPGEILVIEKSYLTSICLEGMYFFCSHCTQQTWASIPCKHCINEIYCSEKCKKEAWKKYHKFECSVLSHLYSLRLDIYPYIQEYDPEQGQIFIRALAAALRLLLLTVHEAGGINEIRKELRKIESCKDPRMKGFSNDGVFHSDKCRSVYGLSTTLDRLGSDTLGVFVTTTCIATYLLAKKTTFFGKKKYHEISKATPSEMMLNEDIKFIGALLLKNSLLLPNNTLRYFVHRESTILGQKFGAALYPFCSFFNHSCDPNVKSIPTKNNERIVYSKHPIEQGEQLFICYVGDGYVTNCKQERTETLRAAYCFQCKCEACIDNWPTTLPFVKDIIKESARVKRNLQHKHKYLEKLKENVMKNLENSNYRFDQEMMKSVRKLMREYANSVTVRCMDYEMFEHFIYMMLVSEFGTWLNVPSAC